MAESVATGAVDRSGPPKETRAPVRAIARAHHVLEVLSREPRGLGLSEIARRANIRFSTCHRLLATLTSLDYVIQDSETGHYLLGYKVLELASRAQSFHHLLIVRARPVLAETMQASGETTNLAVRDEQGARYVAQVPSRASVRMFAEIGSPAPLHATAVGKVLLAHADEAVLESVVRDGLAARARHTLTDADQLRAALSEIRAQGYAVDNEEFEDGVMCVAAPVRNHTSDVVAALSVSGPSGRIAPSLLRLTALVVEKAVALSTALGCPALLSAMRASSVEGSA